MALTRRAPIIQLTSVVSTAFGALIAGLALWDLAFQALLGSHMPTPPTNPPPLDIISIFWRHMTLLASVQAAAGLIVVAAGFNLWRGAHWARAALEGVIWLALLTYVSIGVLCIIHWSRARLPVTPMGQPLRRIRNGSLPVILVGRVRCYHSVS